MHSEGYITEDERRAADGEPLPTAPSLEEAIVGPYFSEEIRRYLERTYGEQELYRRGLRIESTLDPELQRWSEEALGWGLRRLARRHSFRPPRNLLAEGYTDLDAFVDPSWEGSADVAGSARGVVLSASRSGAEVRVGRRVLPLPPAGFAWTTATDASRILRRGDLVAVTVDRKKEGTESLSLEQDPNEEGAVLVIENATGAVRAMVGGYDWNRSKFNRSTQALRQAGSTFKPFVYLAALEAGYTPSDTVFDGPIAIVFDPRQPPYRPHNYDNRFRGIVTMRRALEYSYNVSAVRVSELVGRSHVIEAAHRLGIRQKLSPYPSVALGAFEVTLAEMTSAFSVFANQGLAFPMYLFDRITDANGDLLEQTHPDAREVVSPTACFQLLQMLKGVTERGTAASAARLKLNIAGKTGTTNDFTDAWFIGMTPRYTIGVWVGNDRKNASLGKGMDGARAALPIWIRVVEKMKEAGRIDPKEDFEAPPNVVFTAVDYETGLKATRESPQPILETFVSGSQPTEEWSSRWEEITRLPWSLQRSFYLPKKGEGTDEVPAPPATPRAASPAPAPTP
jgi:penicillin-binding protein 1A